MAYPKDPELRQIQLVANRERARAKRDKRKAAGVCVECGIKPPGNALRGSKRKISHCDDCAEELRVRTASRRSTPWGRAQWLVEGARDRARERGLAFSLSIENIAKRIARLRCEVTGLPLSLSDDGHGRRRQPWAPSLDRFVDPAGGYTEENVRVTCWIYNRAKELFSHDDFVLMCLAIAKKEGWHAPQ